MPRSLVDSDDSRPRSAVQPVGDLQSIAGVGPKITRKLNELGVWQVSDLNRASPQELYERLCALEGYRIDRCVLYVFRCAVYYASNATHDPKLLQWWNWKDDG